MRTKIQQGTQSLTCLTEGFVMHCANDSEQPRQTYDVKTEAPKQQVQGQSHITIHMLQEALR